ncbi:hypothetical protein K504DRAFT_66449 [Pleomassaria siparia CBS 279.74]|uniref:Uncharacterized protein n=1 Tax=Pleomassaria siparia CBS 279.74 TaxID=1314801 RepID=A0A6G1K2V7_9PLEO|nr:hypothetical protein K504DRAFT_66449 [Pleomassaria siparia CBS 279.74]
MSVVYESPKKEPPLRKRQLRRAPAQQHLQSPFTALHHVICEATDRRTLRKDRKPRTPHVIIPV